MRTNLRSLLSLTSSMWAPKKTESDWFKRYEDEQHGFLLRLNSAVRFSDAFADT
jgi:hypothetical protein